MGTVSQRKCEVEVEVADERSYNPPSVGSDVSVLISSYSQEGNPTHGCLD